MSFLPFAQKEIPRTHPRPKALERGQTDGIFRPLVLHSVISIVSRYWIEKVYYLRLGLARVMLLAVI